MKKYLYVVPQYLMILFIFLSPFTQDTSIKEFCFYISAAFLIFSAIFYRQDVILHTPLVIPLAIFGVWAMVGIPTALNKPNTIHDIFAHWIKYVVIYYLLVNYFRRPGELLRLATLVVITGCVYAVWYISYYYLYLGHSWSDRLVMYPYRDFLFAPASMIAIGLIQHHRSARLKLFFSAALACILAGAIFSQARNVVLAITVGSIVYMVKYRKTALCLLLVVIISVVSFPAFRERLRWETLVQSDRISTNLVTLEIIEDFPLFGIGFGMQTYGYKKYIGLEAYYQKIPKQFQHGIILGAPHNLLMDVTVRTGILGGLLFILIYWRELRMLFLTFRRSESSETQQWALTLSAAFIAFLVQSQFGDAAFGLQAIVFFTILSMTSILWRQYQMERCID